MDGRRYCHQVEHSVVTSITLVAQGVENLPESRRPGFDP